MNGKMRSRASGMQDRSGGLFEPDVLLPGQFFSFFRKEAGFDRERRLMLAVLEDAIDCFQKYAHTSDLRGRQLFAESYEWIMSPDKRWLFSFENICQIVDMNPDYIRQGLSRWRVQNAKSGVPLEAGINFQTKLTGWLLTAGAGLERHLPRLAPGEGVRLLKHSYALMIGLFSLRNERNESDVKCPVLPGLGTYQQEASLALIRYWAHVAGVPDSTVAAMSRATGLPEFNRDITNDQP